MSYSKNIKYFSRKLLISFLLVISLIKSGITQTIDVPSNITQGYYISLPFGGNNLISDIRYQYIILADELLNVGLKKSDILKSIGYNFTYMNSKAYSGLTIKLKLTNSTILTTWDDIGSTQVYYGSPTISNLGWYSLPLLNNFSWDGTSNILVSICWDNSTTSLGGGIQFSTNNNGRTIYNGATSGFGCSLTQAYSSTYVPITRFEYQRNTLSPTSITSNKTTICNGANTNLTVNGNDGTTYWFTNSCGISISNSIGNGNSIIVNPTTTTTYYARNYNAGKWSLTCAQITITVVNAPSTPTNISSNSPQCNYVNITRNVAPSTGITWYWQGTNPSGTSTNLGSGSTFNVTTSGTYYIRAKNNNADCWSIQSGIITVKVTNPSAPINPSSNSPQCSSVTIASNGIPSSGITWYWQGNNPSGTSTNLGSGSIFNATTSGTYYIRAKNNIDDCWSTESGSINVDVLGYPNMPNNPYSNSPQCSLINITRNGAPSSGITWYWQGTNPNGTSTTSGSGNNYNATSSGTYYIRAKNNIADCWSIQSGSVKVDVLGYPDAPNNPSSNSPQCSLINITRNGAPSSGITWYWQGTNPNGTSTIIGSSSTYNTTSSGTYYIRAKNNIADCWSNQSGSVKVDVLGYPNTPNNPSSNSPQCSSVKITRNGEPTSGITWYWQGINPDGKITTLGSEINYNVNSSGTYYIRAKNNIADCWSIKSGSVLVDVISTSDTTYIQTTAIDKFTFNNTTYTENGIYFNRFKNINGCDSIIALNLIFDKSKLNEKNYSKLTIYPNPSNNGIFSIGSEENIRRLFITDISGKIVQYKLNNNCIDISNLSPGIYNLNIEFEHQKYSIKIVYLE